MPLRRFNVFDHPVAHHTLFCTQLADTLGWLLSLLIDGGSLLVLVIWVESQRQNRRGGFQKLEPGPKGSESDEQSGNWNSHAGRGGHCKGIRSGQKISGYFSASLLPWINFGMDGINASDE